MTLEQRAQNILRLFNDGATLAYIGSLYGISRERVRQIVVKNTRQDRKCMREIPSSLWGIMYRNGIKDITELEKMLEKGTVIKFAGKGCAFKLSIFFKREVYVNIYSNYFIFMDMRKSGTANRKVRAALAYYGVKMKRLGEMLNMNKDCISNYLSDELSDDEQNILIGMIEKEAENNGADK